MPEDEWNDDMEDVEPVVEADGALLDAFEALDLEKILPHWSESDLVSIVFPGIDMAKGPVGLRMALSEIIEHTTKLALDLKPLSYMRHGDLAWSFSTGHLISTHQDETLSVEIYMTNIWRREVGGWKLMHLNCSPTPHQPSWLEQRLN